MSSKHNYLFYYFFERRRHLCPLQPEQAGPRRPRLPEDEEQQEVWPGQERRARGGDGKILQQQKIFAASRWWRRRSGATSRWTRRRCARRGRRRAGTRAGGWSRDVSLLRGDLVNNLLNIYLSYFNCISWSINSTRTSTAASVIIKGTIIAPSGP